MLPELPDQITLVEMGARDGLQNQPGHITAEQRAQFINLLSLSGLSRIEAGSFVSPKAVPQMADSGKVFKLINRKPGIIYSALTPNLKGFEAALAAGVNEAAVFGSVSETFSQHNINCSVSESLKRFEPVLKAAHRQNIPVRGYISCVLGCPYEGFIKPDKVARISKTLLDLGCYEISLGDTIGKGTPVQAAAMVNEVANAVPAGVLAAHFHNTFGQALANLYAVIREGITVIDASVAGLGGCPHAPGASGNVATEDVVYMLDGMGIKTGINMAELLKAATFICELLGIESRSNAGIALKQNRNNNSGK